MKKYNLNMSAKLDLMEPHVEHLARMRDEHRSTGEILHWLWTQGVKIHGGHLTAFWERREQRQANPPPPTQRKTRPSDGRAELPLRRPSPPGGEGGRRPDEVSPAPSHASAAPDPNHASAASHHRAAALGAIMDNYLASLKDLIDKCAADPNPKLEDRQQIDRMVQIALDYQRDQDQKAQRQQALDLKQAEYELKVKRLALMEQREAAKAKAREAADTQREPSRDFDNTDLIADMRGEMFKEVYSPENMAKVDAALAKAEAHLDPENNPNIIHCR
jgi:hypothetical protein